MKPVGASDPPPRALARAERSHGPWRAPQVAPFTARTEGGPCQSPAVKSGAEAAAGARRTSRLVIVADVLLQGRMAVARCLRAVISLADG